jgi:hypothetical protein
LHPALRPALRDRDVDDCRRPATTRFKDASLDLSVVCPFYDEEQILVDAIRGARGSRATALQ